MLAFVFVTLPWAGALAAAQPLSQSVLHVHALDRTADPCTDFYRFTCGGWLANSPMPEFQKAFLQGDARWCARPRAASGKTERTR